MHLDNKQNLEGGSILIFEIVIIFIFSLVVVSVLGNAVIQHRVIRSTVAREQAFHIAEAGANYYQWRLAHFPSDFQNGTGQPGPYVIDYKDTDNQTVIGRYSLQITPPATGSTVVTIRSTGWTLANPNVRRTITTRYGIPSIAKYAFLTNSDVWIGNTESINGQLHANGGIRFDGTGNAPIVSAKSTYNCQSWSGSPCPTTKPGIWGAAPVSTQNYWQFPVPSVDFSSITSDLANIKSQAQSGGIYLSPSNAQGYSLVFNSNSTVTVYKVTSLRSDPTGWDINGVAHNEDIDYNGRTLVATYPLPTNGVMFVEDRTWVEGTVSGRVLVAAAKLPYNAATAPSILIPNNLTYTIKDGTVALGLVAQKDILITYFAPNTLSIDAAMIAQNGSAQYYYFPGNLKTQINIYGSVASFGVWTWSWVNGSGVTISGFPITNTTYDSNLLYAPPPSFPLTPSGYQQITWQSD